jgi:hypothetical protein
MTAPMIIHQSDIAASGRKMIFVLRVIATLWLISTVLVCYFTAPSFDWLVMAILLAGMFSLIALYQKIRRMPNTPGSYRILISDKYLIRESSHSWFGEPFSVALKDISELIIEEDQGSEGVVSYRYYIGLTGSPRIRIIEDYTFSPERLFDELLKLRVASSVSRIQR